MTMTRHELTCPYDGCPGEDSHEDVGRGPSWRIARWEESVMVDCIANGCDPHHDDHGQVTSPEIYERWEYPLPTVGPNGHKLTRVRRFIGTWEPVEGEES